MTVSQFLFAGIDVLFHIPQNYRRYPNITKEKDFAYDPSFPKECRAEFYYDPTLLAEKKKLPVVVNIHGGGFVKGDKRHRSSLSKRFASHGYFTMNVNHRLSPQESFPIGIHDIINALNYLKSVEEKYNLDLTKVCITGDSSGGYYATQIVSVANDEEQRKKLNLPEVLVKPALLVSFCGPYDLIAALSMTKLPSGLVWDIGNCLLGSDFGLSKDFSNAEKYSHLKELSPTNFVNSNWCPAFLVMSQKDLFCAGHGEILAEALKEKGVEVKTFSSTKLIDNHCFHMNMFTKVSKDCFRQVFEFMDSHLKG